MRTLILAEGGLEWGLGHLNRCIGFADAVRTAGSPVRFAVFGDEFAHKYMDQHIETHVRLQGWNLEELAHLVDEDDLVIVDSYHAPLPCYEYLAKLVPHRLWIDDTARLDYPAGHVVNPNQLVEQKAPRTGEDGRWLLSGYAYQPLRREFHCHFDRTVPNFPRRILVSMGGTDLRGLTPTAVSAAQQVFPDARITAVVPRTDLRTGWSAQLHDRATFLHSRSAAEMRQLMEESDIAISAGGQTLLECLRLGLPTIAIEVAENQRIQIESLRRTDSLVFAGCHENLDLADRIIVELAGIASKRRREELASNGQRLVDGRGCERCIGDCIGQESFP